MQEPRAPEREAPVNTAILVSGSRVRPSISKMLTTYLADIEQLVDEQSWDIAVREALDLPSIAVALSDPHLRSSAEQARKWCTDWVRPLRTDGDSRGLDHERISGSLLARVSSDESHDGVPARALRRLRLRRLARTPPNRFATERTRTPDAEANDAADLCTLVVEAIRRWYSHAACCDPIVQANLGRLAILR